MTISNPRTPGEAALEYASRGWSIIPMHSITEDGFCSCGAMGDYAGGPIKHAMGKHPYTEHGHKDASTVPSQIALWWTMWPEANIAIATGAPSGLVVLDVDVAHSGYASLGLMLRQNGALPMTPKVKSGGGGEHYYFKAPRTEIRGRRQMRPGVDFMGDGGRIVAPPSRHKTGWRYEWDEKLNPDTVPFASLPAWLEAMVRNTPWRKRRVKTKAFFDFS